MCTSFPVCFHHTAPAVKASLPEAFLIEKAAPFTVRSALNFTRATAVPLRPPVAPSRNIMFVYLWREFILLIHWLALLQRLKEFDFLFIYSLHFSSRGRAVSCVIPREKLPSLSPVVPREMRLEGGRETRDRGQGT